MLQLVLAERRRVVPYYVVDAARRSFPVEIRTIRTLRTAMAARAQGAGALLSPTVMLDREDLPVDPDDLARWTRLRAAGGPLGGQYLWLAAVAHEIGHPLELSIHRDDRAHAFLSKAVRPDPVDGVHVLVEEPQPADLVLFRSFRFPLFDLGKPEMASLAEEQGFADLLELSWFCHRPRGRWGQERACGTCGPCQFTQQEGLARRVPLVGRAAFQAQRVARIVTRPLPRTPGPA